MNQEVDVVAVMAVRIEHVGLHVAALVVRRRRERRDRVVDPIALRVDVAGHVERVRDVGHQLGIAPAGVPRALGRLAAFVAVNQVVMRAEGVVVLGDDLLEQRDAFERVGARLLGHRIVAVEQRQPQNRGRLFIVRDARRRACAGRRCGRRPRVFDPGLRRAHSASM